MSIIVQKYGGTSVATKEKLENICSRIISYINKKNKLVIVVSAQGKTTDKLNSLSLEYSDNPNKEDLDLLLSIGEVQTVALLSMMLKDKGIKVATLTGGQIGIVSDSNFGNAKIENIYTDNIIQNLNNDTVVIIPGFQAINKFGEITTLGRGGSDLTAVALACSLKANRCEIYTDVDGVLTSNPKVVHKTKLLKNISYDEMLQAASSGAKVLHDRCVSLAKKYDLNINVKNSDNNSKGSVVSNITMESSKISILSNIDNLSKISIVGNMLLSNNEILVKIFSILAKENIKLENISFSETCISLIISNSNMENLINILHNELITNS